MWAKIKAFLKRFLPIPARTSLEHMQALNAKIDKSDKEIEQLNRNIEQIHRNISVVLEDHSSNVLGHVKLLAEILIQQEQIAQNSYNTIQKCSQMYTSEQQNLATKMERLLTELGSMKYYVYHSIDKCVFYDHQTERSLLKPFMEFKDRSDYEQCYLNLVAGLDDNSVKQVVRVLKRQELVYGTEGPVDLFTREEQQFIRHANQMRNNILKISDQCYCMGQYMLPINHFEVCVFFDHHGIDLIYNKGALKNKHIMDIGGFVGDSILVLANLTNKHIHSFEAMSENYTMLQKTIQLNGVTNAVPVKAALGAKVGKLMLNCAGSSSSLVDTDIVEYTEEVDVITLDDYVSENSLEVGLIKVDIEGAEQQFLKGAKKTICQQKPVLLLSIYHNPEDFYFIKPIIESWDLGYELKIHKSIDYSVSQEVLLIAQLPEKNQ